MRLRILAIAPALLLLSGLAPQLASAQSGAGWRARREARREAAAQRRAERNGRGTNMRGLRALPPKWVRKLQDMPPAEQEKFLRNNERFRSLPPQRQEQIRRNLRRWNSLTPEQKRAARNAEAALEHMTPEQREYVRKTLLPKWRALPLRRRLAIRRRLAVLSRMSPATQQDALHDPRFMRGLSPDEQDLLRHLNSLRNPNPPSK